MKLLVVLTLFAANAHGRKILTAGETPDEINGTTILKGTRGDKKLLGSLDIHRNLSFLQDPDFNKKLKSGQLKEVKFTQSDVDLIAQTTTSGYFDFFSEYPVAHTKDMETKLNQLPAIISRPHGLNSTSKRMRRKILRRGPTPVGDSFVPLLPEMDSFYSPSWPLPPVLGTPINFRRVLTSYSIELENAFQLTYRTEDSHGIPNADLTTIFVPRGARTDYFVSYQFHEDSAKLFCANSYVVRLPFQDAPLQSFLDNKFPVSFPDYEGPNSIFMGNLRSARSVLNSIRAVRQSLPQLGIQTQLAFLYGYSGASVPTGKAAELVWSYAPDLNGIVNGLAVGGYSPDVSLSFDAVNQGHFAGLIPMAFGSLAREYPEIAVVLAEHLTSQGASQVTTANAGCSQVLYLFLGQDMYGITDMGRDILTEPTIINALSDNSAAKNAPPMPVLFVQSTADETSPIQGFQNVANVYCQGGASVAWHRSDTENHGSWEGQVPLFVPQFFVNVANGASPAAPCASWDGIATI